MLQNIIPLENRFTSLDPKLKEKMQKGLGSQLRKLYPSH
jgi:hypothetical protein